MHRRSGVKLDVTRPHAASVELELDTQKHEAADAHKEDEMEFFSGSPRPRSRSGFQATSPLAIAQRRTVAEAVQRPKSAYLLNGHCELNHASSGKDPHDGYHTDGEDGHHYLKVSDYQQAINQCRRSYESPMSSNLVGSSRYSSASSICSSEDEENTSSWLSFRKSQSDIGTMRVQSLEESSELLEKMKMLEKQNEILKQQLEVKSMKDEAIQVQQYSVVSSHVYCTVDTNYS